MQDGHPISFASRALTDCETRYAQIEKELLAIVFACERFNTYVYGRDIVVQSDHKPLEAIFSKPVVSTTPRLQRMLLRLGRYRLKVKYTPGKEMYIADALSRAYVKNHESAAESELAEDLDVAVHSVLFRLPISNARINEIRAATSKDHILSQIEKFLTNGLPVNSNALPQELKSYRQILSDLYVVDGIIFKDQRIVIPAEMRNEFLKKLHVSHMGIEKTKQLARQHYYWPGMDSDIELHVRRCCTCSANRKRQQKQPLIPHPIPEYPWQKVGCDIFTFKGRDHLLVVDYFSKFCEVVKLKSKTASAVINKLQTIFSRFGVPEIVMADNMPFASLEFRKFADMWNFQVSTSSPNYPQSNGQAERAIQTVKRLMKKAYESGQNIQKALLHLRCTPMSNVHLSPAQLLYNRCIRTDLPAMTDRFLSTSSTEAKEQLERKQLTEKYYADKGSKELPSLYPGETVRIKLGDQLIPGRVLEELDFPRSFRVISVDGYEYRRNRRDLVKTLEQAPSITPAPLKTLSESIARPQQNMALSETQLTLLPKERVQPQGESISDNTTPQPSSSQIDPPSQLISRNAVESSSPTPILRRSTRTRKAPTRFSP